MSSKPLGRWLQLTFLFSAAFLTIESLVAGPFGQGNWFPFALALGLGALAAFKWMYPGSGSGGGGDDDDDDDDIRVNPATGLPMIGDGPVDVGGNVFGSSNDD